ELFLYRVMIDTLLDEVVVGGTRCRDLAHLSRHRARTGESTIDREQEPCLVNFRANRPPGRGEAGNRAVYRCVRPSAVRRNRAVAALGSGRGRSVDPAGRPAERAGWAISHASAPDRRRNIQFRTTEEDVCR